MTIETWLAFCLASAAILAIPGPTVTLVVSYTLGHRRRGSMLAAVIGVVLGDFTAMSISLLGAGAMLQASATLFTAMKLVGAIYLIWLGVSMWRSAPIFSTIEKTAHASSVRKIFTRTYLVTTFNPKTIIFFIAFLPQFVSPDHQVVVQFVLLEVTFLTLATLNIALWALLASAMMARFQRPSSLQIANRVAGSILIFAGFLTAFSRRS